MDIGYTYVLADDSTGRVYLPQGVLPPSVIPVQRLGVVEEMRRLSDRDHECENAIGDSRTSRGCTDADCHRRELGKCQCGRHPGEIPFRRAVAS